MIGICQVSAVIFVSSLVICIALEATAQPVKLDVQADDRASSALNFTAIHRNFHRSPDKPDANLIDLQTATNQNQTTLSLHRIKRCADSTPCDDDSFQAKMVKKTLDYVSRMNDPSHKIMVYNLNQGYENGIVDQVEYQDFFADGIRLGVWVVKCGYFINKGDRGWDNWGFETQESTGDHRYQDGNAVKWFHKDCSNPAYRPSN